MSQTDSKKVDVDACGPDVPDQWAVAADDIAVIGMACRFPGADDYDEFWRNLASGVCSVTEVPADRWDWRSYDGDPQREHNKSVSRWGGFMRHADRFEPEFFGISPREAVWMDPQQRMALDLSWQCMEDAGYRPDELEGTRVGVYIGACNFDYKTLQERNCSHVEGHIATGNANAIIPNRVSYLFNFRGPSIAVDTACSSSLVAMQQAVAALRQGDCDTALVGGVGLLATPDRYISFSIVGMLSPTGSCKAFDAAADGYVRAEGAGIVMLKPLRKAQVDGDRIWGVIKSVAVSHGGRARSLTAPNALSQAQVITRALRMADIDPQTITYVETHGTGTPLGDPIEVHGLQRAFDRATRVSTAQSRTGYCALGAVKSNIGHLEGSAGIAGVIKVLLALRHRQIPGNANFKQINPRIKLEGSAFYIADRLHDWTPLTSEGGRPLPRRAGVSSFGFGGVNSHVIIEEAPPDADAAATVPMVDERPQVLTLSARSEQSLVMMAERYAQILERDDADVAAICRQTNWVRAGMPCRWGVAAESGAALGAQLRERLASDAAQAGEAGAAGAVHKPKIGFLFTGQGSQYLEMGRALHASEPGFRAAFDECDALIAKQRGRRIVDVMFGGDAAALDQTCHTQPALFALEYALAQMWKGYGVEPAAVLGHSVGEVVAACVAGMFSLADGVALICARATLMQDLCAAGAMATVFAPLERVQAVIAALGGGPDIAAVNAPAAVVIAGARPWVAEALRLLAAAGIESRTLQVERGFHSVQMEPMQVPFAQVLSGFTFALPATPVISNVTGAPLVADQCGPHYWVEHARKPVLFQQGVRAMRETGVNVFLELGPSATLIKLARQSVADAVAWLPSLDPQQSAPMQVARTLMRLYELGVNIDFAPRSLQPRRIVVDLPAYPFAGRSYWVPRETAGVVSSSASSAQEATGNPWLGDRIDLAGSDGACFVQTLDLQACAAHRILAGHRLREAAVMPGAAFASLAAAALQMLEPEGHGPMQLEDVRFLRSLPISSGTRYQTVLKCDTQPDTHRFEVWSRDASADQSTPQAERSAWLLHATGRVARADALTAGQPLAPSGDAGQLDVHDFYARWAGRGLHYGPEFQGIARLALKEEVCTGRVRLPDTASVAGHTGWHPAMLDAIWQVALPLLPATVAEQGLLPLPVRIERMVAVPSWPQEVDVQAVLAGGGADARGLLQVDLEVRQVDGTPLAQIRGLALQPSAHDGQDRDSAVRAGAVLHLEPTWVRVPPPDMAAAEAPLPDDAVHLVVHAGGPNPWVGAFLSQPLLANAFTIGIREPLAAPGALLWDGRSADALDRVLAALPPIRCVWFLALCEPGTQAGAAAGAAPSLQWLEQAQQDTVLALFRLIKAMERSGRAASGFQLRVVADRVHAVRKGEHNQPWAAGVFGLAGVYANENRAVQVVNFDLDLGEAADPVARDHALSFLLAEPAQAEPRLVAWRGGWRYERRLEPVQVPSRGEAPFKAKGVYVLLGGLGGIGQVLAQHLGRGYQARLLLIGRRAPDAEVLHQLHLLEQSGATVRYAQADAADPQSLMDAMAPAVADWGGIDGVVHGALQLQDGALASMDEARFRATFDAKVLGSLALYEAVRQVQPAARALDFFAFFSSAVSFLANPGQANYVAGSLFQDTFARYLESVHQVPAKVINWGRWGQVGAVSDARFAARLDAQGIHAMTPAEGMAALDAVLQGPASHCVVIKASEQALARMGALPQVRAQWVPAACTRGLTPVSADGSLVLDPATRAELPDSRTLGQGYEMLNRLAVWHVEAALAELQGDEPLQGVHTLASLQKCLGVDAAHLGCLGAIARMMVRTACWRQEAQAFHVAQPPRPALSGSLLHERHEEALRAFPWLLAELRLLRCCGPMLAKVLSGRLPATSVLFPDLKMDLVEGVYSAGPMAMACNGHLARQVADAAASLGQSPGAERICILEVGAGTGGTTSAVLAKLRQLPAEVQARLQYTYTDISPAFLSHGRERFGARHPFVEFRLLNIEEPPIPQGCHPGEYDIVVASNVLHATRSLSRTLQHVKFLLKRGGMLLLNEAIERQDFLTVTFGLLEGWWLAEDTYKRIEDSPLLSRQMWRTALDEEGFGGFACAEVQAAGQWSQGVLSAVSNGRYLLPLHPGASAAAEPVHGRAAPAAQAHALAGDSGGRRGAAALLDLAAGTDVQALGRAVSAYLQAELADVLQLRPGQLERSARPVAEMFLSELGMDSLTAMDLRNRLRSQLGQDVSVEVLLGGTRVRSIVDLVIERLLVQRLAAPTGYGNGATGAQDSTDDVETFTL